MNSEYSREVEKLSAAFSDAVSNSEAFTQQEKSSFNNEISNRVLPLLNSPKPKILVYGIYNGGKSTLVNAICGHEVAEVGNRPTTHETHPYDAGKYVLVDSPGIDAGRDAFEKDVAKKDETIATEKIKECHVILFVVTSEGTFESKKNYEKMHDLMNMGIPFIIVLNDYGASKDEKEKHLQELNGIENKILENLQRESGIEDVTKKYSVIRVNAQLAWKAASTSDPKLAERFRNNSHISDLTSAIEERLEKKGAMEIYAAPLSALEGEINRAEELIMKRKVTEDFAGRRSRLQQKVSDLQSSMERAVRNTASRYTEEIYHSFLGEGGRKITDINNEIISELEERYKTEVSPILTYIRKSFPGENITVDDSGNVRLEAPDVNFQPSKTSASESGIFPAYSDGSDSVNYDTGKITTAAAAGAATGAAIGSVIPVLGTTVGTAVGAALAAGAEFFRQMFGGNNDQKEFERRQREIEAFNKMQAQHAEEDRRRRQDARTAAEAQINSAVKNLRAYYSQRINSTFTAVERLIDSAAAKNSASNSAIDRTMETLSGLKANIHSLRQKTA